MLSMVAFRVGQPIRTSVTASSFHPMSTDPVSNVVDGERPKTLDASDSGLHKPMKTGEVASLGQIPSDRLKTASASPAVPPRIS